MVPFKSGKTCNALEPNTDRISNLPDIVIDKILKCLPIKTVAKMSILSRKWRHIWLSLKYLVFDEDFWEELYDGSRHSELVLTSWNRIISDILFHHVGAFYEFLVYIPYCKGDHSYSGWVSLLSKVGVKKISILVDLEHYAVLPSYIFDCKDLVKLRIECSISNSIPNQFKAFAYLRSLVLVDVVFQYDVFASLIVNCPRLKVLMLEGCTFMNNPMVIDAPSLEHLTLHGDFESIVFKNVPRLSVVSLYKKNDVVKAKGVDHSFEMLASSCQLQDMYCGGRMCKYFGAGCITMSPTLKFLHKLRLTDVDLSDFDEFCFTLGILQCCPFIKDLDIIVESKKCDIEHEFDFKCCELRHLVKVEITGLIGSIPELKLIEYLLSIASKLEVLAFMCYKLDPISELKVTRDLTKLPRASPKAKLVCLGK